MLSGFEKGSSNMKKENQLFNPTVNEWVVFEWFEYEKGRNQEEWTVDNLSDFKHD